MVSEHFEIDILTTFQDNLEKLPITPLTAHFFPHIAISG